MIKCPEHLDVLILGVTPPKCPDYTYSYPDCRTSTLQSQRFHCKCNLPVPDLITGLHSELSHCAGRKLLSELVLLGLVADQLLPILFALVPLQLVVSDG